MNRGFSVQTYKNNIFDPATGEIDNIDIEDIAHALSNICRYSGHCRRFYSVAEHSVLVYKIIKSIWPDDVEAQWAGLLHDATEAYVGDVTTPLKNLLPEYKVIEDTLAIEIAKKFKIRRNKQIGSKVRTGDLLALATEAPELFDDVAHWTAIKEFTPMKRLLHREFPISPEKAKELFLNEFKRLQKKVKK